jgi:hypothetical protein
MIDHFLRRLHSNEMKVYIEARAHGYDPEKLMAAGESCGKDRAAGYCTHPLAGLYSLVPPGAPGKGGYIENYITSAVSIAALRDRSPFSRSRNPSPYGC